MLYNNTHVTGGSIENGDIKGFNLTKLDGAFLAKDLNGEVILSIELGDITHEYFYFVLSLLDNNQRREVSNYMLPLATWQRVVRPYRNVSQFKEKWTAASALDAMDRIQNDMNANTHFNDAQRFVCLQMYFASLITYGLIDETFTIDYTLTGVPLVPSLVQIYNHGITYFNRYREKFFSNLLSGFGRIKEKEKVDNNWRDSVMDFLTKMGLASYSFFTDDVTADDFDMLTAILRAHMVDKTFLPSVLRGNADLSFLMKTYNVYRSMTNEYAIGALDVVNLSATDLSNVIAILSRLVNSIKNHKRFVYYSSDEITSSFNDDFVMHEDGRIAIRIISPNIDISLDKDMFIIQRYPLPVGEIIVYDTIQEAADLASKKLSVSESSFEKALSESMDINAIRTMDTAWLISHVGIDPDMLDLYIAMRFKLLLLSDEVRDSYGLAHIEAISPNHYNLSGVAYENIIEATDAADTIELSLFLVFDKMAEINSIHVADNPEIGTMAVGYFVTGNCDLAMLYSITHSRWGTLFSERNKTLKLLDSAMKDRRKKYDDIAEEEAVKRAEIILRGNLCFTEGNEPTLVELELPDAGEFSCMSYYTSANIAVGNRLVPQINFPIADLRTRLMSATQIANGFTLHKNADVEDKLQMILDYIEHLRTLTAAEMGAVAADIDTTTIAELRNEMNANLSFANFIAGLYYDLTSSDFAYRLRSTVEAYISNQMLAANPAIFRGFPDYKIAMHVGIAESVANIMIPFYFGNHDISNALLEKLFIALPYHFKVLRAKVPTAIKKEGSKEVIINTPKRRK